jgi:DNA-binding transcriptional MocR family regulator
LAPTVRLGWAVLPARLVVPAANQIFSTSIATPRLTQFALAELIERGYLDRLSGVRVRRTNGGGRRSFASSGAGCRSGR